MAFNREAQPPAMTTSIQPREPRSGTILRHTRQAIHDGALKVLPFSKAVAERYLSDVTYADRTVPLRELGESAESMRAAEQHNWQRINRLVCGDVKAFPADLEDAWVASLPDQYRQQCEHDLSARRGFVPVRDPRAATTPSQQSGELSDLLREVGESAAALAPIFADGKVDSADLPYIAPALARLGGLLTAGLQVHQRLTDVVLSAQGAMTAKVTKLRRRS